jgi:peptide methionine sulfoxide reductase msrA/msrB
MNKKIKLIPYILMLNMLFLFSACAQGPKKTNAAVLKNDSMMNKTEDYWKSKLTEEQYYILREKGTERPYTGELLLNKDSGIYKCSACGNPLFSSDGKFDSHCGWPSFDREVKGGKIKTQTDYSMGMERTEIMCGRCGGHLGHLFNDGPTNTGLRYCVNSVSLEFVPKNEMEKPASSLDTLVLGGGCFWCVEAVYENLTGVISVESGYSGGTVMDPSYAQVCTGNTGHAEVVQVIFDKNKTSIDEVLKVFFTVHDPTTLNRQGADRGTQYRSVIFYRNPEQKKIAESIIAELERTKVYDDKIVTLVEPYKAFYKADLSHQDYFANNKNQPYCQMVIQPKVDKFEKVFKDRLKKK